MYWFRKHLPTINQADLGNRNMKGILTAESFFPITAETFVDQGASDVIKFTAGNENGGLENTMMRFGKIKQKTVNTLFRMLRNDRQWLSDSPAHPTYPLHGAGGTGGVCSPSRHHVNAHSPAAPCAVMARTLLLLQLCRAPCLCTLLLIKLFPQLDPSHCDLQHLRIGVLCSSCSSCRPQNHNTKKAMW